MTSPLQPGKPVTPASLQYLYMPPQVRLVQQAAQSLANSTDTALTFGTASEEWDTHGFHSESVNTSRITPTVAGYYRLTGTVFVVASTALTALTAVMAKNGTVQPPRHRPKPAATNITSSVQVTVTLTANGSTDYFEFFAQQTSGGALNTNVGGSFASVFECEYRRPL
jgi:hypothetical protein